MMMSKNLVAQLSLEHLDYLYTQYDLDSERKIKLFQFKVRPGTEVIHQSFDQIIALNLHKALCQLEDGNGPLEEFSYLRVIRNMLKIQLFLEIRHCPISKEFLLGFSYHDIRYGSRDLTDAGFELLPHQSILWAEVIDFSNLIGRAK